MQHTNGWKETEHFLITHTGTLCVCSVCTLWTGMYDEERVDVGIHSHKHLVCGVRCRLRLESVCV